MQEGVMEHPQHPEHVDHKGGDKREEKRATKTSARQKQQGKQRQANAEAERERKAKDPNEPPRVDEHNEDEIDEE
jgi:hypothetical protein